jgi:hypothetical protein
MGKKGGGGFVRLLTVVGSLLALAVAVLLGNGFHIPSVIGTLGLMFSVGAKGFFGLGLLTSPTLNSHPVTDTVDIGFFNYMKMKFLYVCRFQFHNNFLWEEWHDQISNDIIARLEAKGAKKGEAVVFDIPHFEYKDIDPLEFYNNFTRRGRPAILHHVPMKAMEWTPEYLAQRAGDWSTAIRCGPINKNMTVREYVDSAQDPHATRCYLDNNANIFEAFPDLEAELELWRYAPYAMGEIAEEGKRPKGLFFGNLFLGVFPELGVTWHCANYNNLFFMIHGRKTWTFVDPSNSFLMYPTFRPMGRDSISRMTYMASHDDEMIRKYFPLFQYAPKYRYTLSKGDM